MPKVIIKNIISEKVLFLLFSFFIVFFSLFFTSSTVLAVDCQSNVCGGHAYECDQCCKQDGSGPCESVWEGAVKYSCDRNGNSTCCNDSCGGCTKWVPCDSNNDGVVAETCEVPCQITWNVWEESCNCSPPKIDIQIEGGEDCVYDSPTFYWEENYTLPSCCESRFNEATVHINYGWTSLSPDVVLPLGVKTHNIPAFANIPLGQQWIEFWLNNGADGEHTRFYFEVDRNIAYPSDAGLSYWCDLVPEGGDGVQEPCPFPTCTANGANARWSWGISGYEGCGKIVNAQIDYENNGSSPYSSNSWYNEDPDPSNPDVDEEFLNEFGLEPQLYYQKPFDRYNMAYFWWAAEGDFVRVRFTERIGNQDIAGDWVSMIPVHKNLDVPKPQNPSIHPQCSGNGTDIKWKWTESNDSCGILNKTFIQRANDDDTSSFWAGVLQPLIIRNSLIDEERIFGDSSTVRSTGDYLKVNFDENVNGYLLADRDPPTNLPKAEVDLDRDKIINPRIIYGGTTYDKCAQLGLTTVSWAWEHVSSNGCLNKDPYDKYIQTEIIPSWTGVPILYDGILTSWAPESGYTPKNGDNISVRYIERDGPGITSNKFPGVYYSMPPATICDFEVSLDPPEVWVVQNQNVELQGSVTAYDWTSTTGVANVSISPEGPIISQAHDSECAPGNCPFPKTVTIPNLAEGEDDTQFPVFLFNLSSLGDYTVNLGVTSDGKTPTDSTIIHVQQDVIPMCQFIGSPYSFDTGTDVKNIQVYAMDDSSRVSVTRIYASDGYFLPELDGSTINTYQTITLEWLPYLKSTGTRGLSMEIQDEDGNTGTCTGVIEYNQDIKDIVDYDMYIKPTGKERGETVNEVNTPTSTIDYTVVVEEVNNWPNEITIHDCHIEKSDVNAVIGDADCLTPLGEGYGYLIVNNPGNELNGFMEIPGFLVRNLYSSSGRLKVVVSSKSPNLNGPGDLEYTRSSDFNVIDTSYETDGSAIVNVYEAADETCSTAGATPLSGMKVNLLANALPLGEPKTTNSSGSAAFDGLARELEYASQVGTTSADGTRVYDICKSPGAIRMPAYDGTPASNLIVFDFYLLPIESTPYITLDQGDGTILSSYSSKTPELKPLDDPLKYKFIKSNGNALIKGSFSVSDSKGGDQIGGSRVYYFTDYNDNANSLKDLFEEINGISEGKDNDISKRADEGGTIRILNDNEIKEDINGNHLFIIYSQPKDGSPLVIEKDVAQISGTIMVNGDVVIEGTADEISTGVFVDPVLTINGELLVSGSIENNRYAGVVIKGNRRYLDEDWFKYYLKPRIYINRIE